MDRHGRNKVECRRWGRGMLLWGLLIFAAGSSWLLAAEENSSPSATAVTEEKPAPKEKGPKKKKVILRARETLEYNWETGGFRAQKGVVVEIPEDEITITADRADYTGDETGILTAQGHLKFVDPENELTGEALTVYTKEKRAEIRGQVRLVHTPEEEAPEDASDLEKARYEPTTMTCDRLVYFYRRGQRRAEATGNLHFTQKERTATARMLIFYQDARVIDLRGEVRAETQKGERLKADLVRILLDEDRVLLSGHPEIEFYVEEEGEGGEAEQEVPPFPGAEGGKEGQGGEEESETP